MLDLDNFGKKPSDATTDDEFNVTAAPEQMLEVVYDRGKKLIYVIDTSNSMTSRLLAVGDVESYDFSPANIALMRRRIENATVRVAAMQARTLGAFISEDGEDLSAFHATVPHQISKENIENDLLWVRLQNANDELLKAEAVAQELVKELGIKHFEGYLGLSKIEAVQQYLGEMVQERFAKNPGADLHIVEFDTEPRYRKPCGIADLKRQIARLSAPGWDTNITAALEAVIKIVESNPSPVGANQVVFVSDALDHGAAYVLRLVPRLLDARIVLDFIHVLSPNELVEDANSWDKLKEACEATGGTYTRVDSARVFRQKFVESSRRPLLLNAPQKRIK